MEQNKKLNCDTSDIDCKSVQDTILENKILSEMVVDSRCFDCKKINLGCGLRGLLPQSHPEYIKTGIIEQ